MYVNFVLDFVTKLKEKTWTSFGCGKCPNSFEIYCMIQSHQNEKKKKMITTSSTIDIFAYFHIENYTLLKHSISCHCSFNHRTFVFFPIDLNLANGMTGLKINAIGSLGWRLYMPIGWKNIQGCTWSDDKHSPSKPSSPSHLTSKTWYLVLWWVFECIESALRVQQHWQYQLRQLSNQGVKANCKERWWNFVRDDLEGQIEHIVCLPMLPR
jgi:hypothetical protein